MNALHDWFFTQTTGRLRVFVAFAFLAMIGVGALVLFTGNDLVMPWVGAGCGIVFYGAAYVWLHRGAPDTFYQRVNVKGRFVLMQRRVGVIIFGFLWSTILVYGAQALPDPTRVLFGTLQVVMVCTLVNIFRATEEELEYARAMLAEQQVLAEAEAAVQAAAELDALSVPEEFPTGGTVNGTSPQQEYPQNGTIPPSA